MGGYRPTCGIQYVWVPLLSQHRSTRGTPRAKLQHGGWLSAPLVAARHLTLLPHASGNVTVAYGDACEVVSFDPMAISSGDLRALLSTLPGLPSPVMSVNKDGGPESGVKFTIVFSPWSDAAGT